MSETIVLDPAAVAIDRTALDITAWIDSSGPDWGDAAITAHLADAGQFGSSVVDFTVPNRTVTIPLNLMTRGAVTFDEIRRNIQAKTALFQREQGWLSRQTSVGTLYMDVVSASLRLGGDWMQASRSVDTAAVLTLECRPDWYGAEITLDDIVETTAAEIVTKLKLGGSDAVIKGDYPGRVRIVVDDDQGVSQLGLLWGFRSRYYSSATTAALRYEAEALTPLDTAAIATVTGASGGGSNNVIQHSNLAPSWTPVLSTQILSGSAHMTHRGSYQLWARVRTTSATPPRLRLVYDVGDMLLPEENAPKTIPGTSAFYLVDLGYVHLDPARAGTHRWQGIIQAAGTAGGENVSIDKIELQPVAESAGALRGPLTADPGLVSYTARDAFNQTTGNLTGKTAAVGGVWAGSGDADDFQVEANDHYAYRTAVSDSGGSVAGGRIVRAGGSIANAAVQAAMRIADLNLIGTQLGVVARYVNLTNFLVLAWHPNGGELRLTKRVASVDTSIGLYGASRFIVGELNLRLVVLADGKWFVWASQSATFGSPILSGTDTDLATGGALASGTTGIWSINTSPNNAGPTWDNFAAWVPTIDAVLHASQSADLRTEGMEREDPTGSAYGPVTWVTGALPRIPPSGMEGRPVELFLKGTRGDLDQLPDSGIDDISARVHYRPCWLQAPGA
jgi:hypothetical protein